MTEGAEAEKRETVRRRGWRRLVGRLGFLCVLVYGGWCIMLFSCQQRLIFPRDLAGTPLPDAMIPKSVERLWITADDGSKVEAWFIPAPGANASSPGPAAVITHGNGELIDHLQSYAEKWRKRGFSVMLPEYRGYGRCGGSPSEAAIVEDAVRFYDLLVARPEVDKSRIVYHGRSLGSGVAAQLAVKRPPAALILESPFKSVAAFAQGYGIPGFLVSSPFRTDRVLPSLGKPVLILHSHDDEIVPFSHGQRLHELTPGSRLVELTGSHNSALGEMPVYWSSIDELLAKNGLAGHASGN